MTDPLLIEFLSAPDSYPDKPRNIVHVETHISHVFIGDTFVHKIKKAVDFGFLDFTTLSKRHFYCKEEVLLNSRLAREIYLAVVPIYGKEGRYSFRRLKGFGVVEYAVKMKRIPEDKLLYNLIGKGKLLYGALEETGEALALFHKTARVHKSGPYGGLKSMKINTEENFEQIRPYCGVTIEEGFYRDLVSYTRGFLKEKEHLFAERKKQGCVREGHGDLHSQHVCLTSPPIVFDCIEFNKRFRIADILEDIAFLFMDLEYRGRFDLSTAVCHAYLSGLGDIGDRELLAFYKVYRAVVRGKIEGFTADGVTDEAAKKAAVRKGRDYFGLARYYLEDAARPFNPVVLMGVSGSGKSVIARGLFEEEGVVIRSDDMRKRLAGVPAGEHVYVDWGTDIYAPGMTERLYAAMTAEAVARAREGERVVVDATFLMAKQREELYRECCAAGLNPFFIQCFAREEVLKARIGKRMREGSDVSDGHMAVLERQLQVREEPDELPFFRVLKLDTDEDPETIRKALRSFL